MARPKDAKAPVFIHWQNSYTVLDPVLDEQHRTLMEIINDLYEAVRTKDAYDANRLVGVLEDYTASHFAAEEALLRACGYEGYEDHKGLHARMIQRTVGLRAEFQKVGPEVLREALSFLKEWWAGHILKADRAYAPCLQRSRNPRGTPPSPAPRPPASGPFTRETNDAMSQVSERELYDIFKEAIAGEARAQERYRHAAELAGEGTALHTMFRRLEEMERSHEEMLHEAYAKFKEKLGAGA
jgi:hemerythrin-like metal-binding protein